MDLAIVGNGSIGALIDAKGGVVWCCFPRFDGDPVFSSLLGGDPARDQLGVFTIELEGAVRTEQQYLSDTPILVTRFYDPKGAGVEITDFCPRFEERGELFARKLLVRQVRPIGGKESTAAATADPRTFIYRGRCSPRCVPNRQRPVLILTSPPESFAVRSLNCSQPRPVPAIGRDLVASKKEH